MTPAVPAAAPGVTVIDLTHVEETPATTLEFVADRVPEVPTRSPQLVRLALLSALGLGLLGLNVAGSAAPLAPQPVAVTAAAVSTPVALGPRYDDEVPPRRATRSRAVAPKPAAAKRTVVAKKPAARKVTRTRVVARPTWVRPSSAAVSSAYGPRWGRLHKGIDFTAPSGSPIRAIGAGTVVGAGYLPSEGGYGIMTLIRHSNGIVSAYAHQSRALVSAGERVAAGEVIGLVGSTGHSTGPHLHFEIRTSLHGGQISPLPWLRAHGVGI